MTFRDRALRVDHEVRSRSSQPWPPDNIRRHDPAWSLSGSVILLLVANTINIAADLAAMGAPVNLMIGGLTHFIPLRVVIRASTFVTMPFDS
jgi:hypothetical protein